MDLHPILTLTFLLDLLASSIRLATPLVLAAVGEVFAERAGVLNLGVEGIMLFSGFMGFSAAFQMHSLWAGVLVGILVGALMGLLFAFLTITLRSNQVVTGLALLILSTGSATYFQRLEFAVSTIIPKVEPFGKFPIPGLSGIPYIGPLLFNLSPFTYLMAFTVVIALIVLYRTPLGLRISAAGESPQAADTLGVNVILTRYLCVCIGGALAGVAGAFYPLSELGVYADTMVSGRGFIALALVVFGRWDPLWTLAGGLVFGGIDALQSRLQTLGAPIPSNFLLMTPYILTILVLLVGRRRRAPSALCTPYVRE
jgi:general nucleoside transport system permease protein